MNDGNIITEPLNISNILGKKFKLNSSDEQLREEFIAIKKQYEQKDPIIYEPSIDINNDCIALNDIFNLDELLVA